MAFYEHSGIMGTLVLLWILKEVVVWVYGAIKDKLNKGRSDLPQPMEACPLCGTIHTMKLSDRVTVCDCGCVIDHNLNAS